FTHYVDSTNSLRVHFISTSTPTGQIATYSWNFGDGSPAGTTSDPWHIYPNAGTYTVCLYITTTGGCSSHQCETITILQGGECHAQFTFYADSMGTFPRTVHFIDQSTGNPTHWSWHFGDPSSGANNTSSLQNPTHTYTLPGYYNICLSILTNSCQDETCDTIHLEGGNPTNCENSITYTKEFLTVHFTGHTSSPYPTTYSWNFGDPNSGSNNVSTLQNPTHIYPSTNSYTVTLVTIDSTGCTWTRTLTVHVSGTCDLNGHVYAGNTPVDHGFIQLIRVDSANVMTVVQSKDFGDSVGHYAFGGVAPGHYYLKAELLPASIRYGQFAPTYFEHSLYWANANLIVLGQPNNPYNFHLVETMDLPIGSGNIQGTINQNLKFGSGGQSAANVEVLLLDQQNAPFTSTKTDANGHFTFTGIAFGSYVIYPEFPGKSTIPAHITLDNTNSSATLDFNMNAGSIIFGINGNINQPVNQIGEFFPNPVSTNANLLINTSQELTLTASFLNLTGQTVLESQQVVHKGENTLSFSVSELPNGIYFIKILTNNGSTVVRKLVKGR
ncbi:MAG: PKD domain-containing protein, partial [Bacteroidota bacterium]